MITRDNYEEFFLLYTDNELSAAERHEVERFVADHPDLRDEWEALLQCRLSPEPHLAYTGKSALLKPEVERFAYSGEGSAYTGELLSYLDGELDPQNTAKIEAVISQHPLVERELAILRQTVCHPDLTIVFPERTRLYRTEKDRRIIPLPWLRAGIAAAVAGAIALLLLLPARHHSDQPNIVIAAHRDSPAIAHNPPAIAHNSPAIAHKITPAVTPAPVTAFNPIGRQPTTQKDHQATPFVPRPEPSHQKDFAVIHNVEVVHNVPAIEDLAVNAGTNPGSTPGAVAMTGDLTANAANVHLAVQNGIPKEQSSFATQALQEEANDQRNNIFVADESAAPGRGALRGIFRKVKRAIGKTAERDSDGNRQVTVGAFQVSID
jgi:hypothetical protein